MVFRHLLGGSQVSKARPGAPISLSKRAARPPGLDGAFRPHIPIATGHVVGRIASMLSNRSMPRSVVIPELAYPDIGYAIDWLCNTFGFTLRIRMGDHRAQLNVPDGGALVLIEQSAEVSLRTSVMVRVEDAKAHYDRAKRSDVRIVREPTDYPYGERQYNVEDFAGHHWCFSQSIADVDPKEWGGTPAEL
jgi:uncharacterized glyoxalase superfamily protein PhnB